MESLDGHFVHEPLDIEKYSTRVIRVHASASEDDEIKCTLEHFDVETGKPYVCLSYCWGEAEPTHIISINNLSFEVRHNLWTCLRRLRRQKITDRLWIDAICIDQNNLAERGHQVRFMGDIYRMANHVLMYLGDRSWEEALLKAANPTNFIISDRSDYRSEYEREELELHRKCSLPKDFLQEAYWTRMWILQEVLLARVVYILLSDVKLDLRRLITLTNTSTPGGVVIGLRERQGSSRPFRPYDLDDLIIQTSNFDCQEPSDQVYALLGLVRGDITDQFPIDYTRNRSDIAFDVIEHVQINKYLPLRNPKRFYRPDRVYEPALTMNLVMKIFATLSLEVSVWCRECAMSPEHFAEVSEAGLTLRQVKQKFDFAWIQGDFNSHLSCSNPHLSDGASYCTDSRTFTRHLLCLCCRCEILDGRDEQHLELARKAENIMVGKFNRKRPPPDSVYFGTDYLTQLMRRLESSAGDTDSDNYDSEGET